MDDTLTGLAWILPAPDPIPCTPAQQMTRPFQDARVRINTDDGTQRDLRACSNVWTDPTDHHDYVTLCTEVAWYQAVIGRTTVPGYLQVAYPAEMVFVEDN